jgi:uncharacterized protein YndB with AHSA1/START domain
MPKTSHKITINAPKSRLFNALSTKDGLKGWYTPQVEGEVREGETVVLGSSSVHAGVLSGNGTMSRNRYATSSGVGTR